MSFGIQIPSLSLQNIILLFESTVAMHFPLDKQQSPLQHDSAFGSYNFKQFCVPISLPD